VRDLVHERQQPGLALQCPLQLDYALRGIGAEVRPPSCEVGMAFAGPGIVWEVRTAGGAAAAGSSCVPYSTVTLFARLRGWSTLVPRSTAMW
jgi:hypothetical protein